MRMASSFAQHSRHHPTRYLDLDRLEIWTTSLQYKVREKQSAVQPKQVHDFVFLYEAEAFTIQPTTGGNSCWVLYYGAWQDEDALVTYHPPCHSVWPPGLLDQKQKTHTKNNDGYILLCSLARRAALFYMAYSNVFVWEPYDRHYIIQNRQNNKQLEQWAEIKLAYGLKKSEHGSW